ncbi:MAG: RNA 2',3'-cyclic phosphodiesterase [Patescibacteria group bacterium]|nr:RNA 2',3'-cyclic phosphodiesterase [Patescibacteria group bacterium]
MQKRLFVAASLPEDVKKRLFRFVEKEYRDLPVKWVRKENFHLTLNFLGYIPEENIPEICDSIREAAENVQSFELEFQKMEFGPKKDAKKMIWASGEKSEELSELKYRLDKTLGFHSGEKRKFRPHITLGKIIKEKWRKILPEPEVEKNFVFSVPVSSIELFESKFEKGKRVYYILESFSLH